MKNVVWQSMLIALDGQLQFLSNVIQPRVYDLMHETVIK